MNRLTRLTAILLHLQSGRIIRAHELAGKFNISLRTVYRDIQTLSAAGVPIIGEAGSGYTLMKGYRLPPIAFSEEEINSMLTALELFKVNSDLSLLPHFESAVLKAKAVLRDPIKASTAWLTERIKVLPSKGCPTSSHLAMIQMSITKGTLLSIHYCALNTGKLTDREVEPMAVYYTNGHWVMIAFCRERNAMREFRLERIRIIKASGSFTRKDFSFEEYIREKSKISNPC